VAKPEIDVLIEVRDHRNTPARDKVLMSLGYVRGNDLTTDHHFYRRNVAGIRTHKLDVCTHDHQAITQMLRFRDLLKCDALMRHAYAALKLRLESSNTGRMAEYLEQKSPFIISALENAGICISVAPKDS